VTINAVAVGGPKVKIMRLIQLALASTATVIAMSPAYAFTSGNELYNFCTSKDAQEKLFCLGLVVGYFEEMNVGYVCDGYNSKINGQQLMDVVVGYLRAAPSERHRPAAVLATAAYSLAFQCRPIVKNK
jgi:hypothetical protein